MNILIFDDLRDDNIHKNKSIYNNTSLKLGLWLELHNKDERDRQIDREREIKPKFHKNYHKEDDGKEEGCKAHP